MMGVTVVRVRIAVSVVGDLRGIARVAGHVVRRLVLAVLQKLVERCLCVERTGVVEATVHPIVAV